MSIDQRIGLSGSLLAKRQVRGLLKSGASERKMSESSMLGTSSKMSNKEPGAR